MDLTSEEEALFVAISFGKIHRIASLLRHIDDINVRSTGQMTPLIHACSITQGDLCSQIVRMFLKRKECDINAVDLYGRSALMYTCHNSHNTDASRILVRNPKVNTNLTDENGWTALMHAVSNDNHECVEVLLLNDRVFCKVDMNIHNIEGDTALDLALRHNAKHSCQVLVNKVNADTSHVHDSIKLKSLLGKR